MGSGTPDFGLNGTVVVHPTPELPLSSASSCSDIATAVKKEKKKRHKERAQSPAASEASLLGHVLGPAQPLQQQPQSLGASLSGMGRPAMSSSTTSSILGTSLNPSNATVAAMASPQPTSHGADRQKEILRARRRGQTMVLPASARMYNGGLPEGHMPTFVHDRPIDHQPLLRMPSLSSLASRQVLSPTPRGSLPNGSMAVQPNMSASQVAQQLALSPPVGGAALNSSYKSIVLPRDIQSSFIQVHQQLSTPDLSEAASPSVARLDVVSPVTQQRQTPPAATAAPIEPQQSFASVICGNEASAVCTAQKLRFAVDRWPLCLLIFSLLLLSIGAQRLLTFSRSCSVAREELINRPKIDAVVSVMVSMSNYLEQETNSIKASLGVLSLNDTDSQLVLVEPSFVGKSSELRKQLIRARIEHAKALDASLARTNANFVRLALGCKGENSECRLLELATLRDVRSVGLARFQLGNTASSEESQGSKPGTPTASSSVPHKREGEPRRTPASVTSYDSDFVEQHQPSTPQVRHVPSRMPTDSFTSTSSIPILAAIPWAAQRAVSSVLMVALVAYILRRGS
ncbi:Hypothetical protein, putative [Bodo saltans]|uniref:Uncharacterized protein n=1 Tax=Bodo saltans TaxID=75058 RepID=A0A0S4JB04_BODSA|nr:Hypothetical protein, putative [Bodo saltans]|eukprot:CUG88695.1 Hypothetical protein, putative [Bodo saltans]